MPRSSIIAVICDFDDTLGDDTTNLFLNKYLGMSNKQIEDFWKTDVGKLVKRGWDPPLAYIQLILRKLRKQDKKVTNQNLRSLGQEVLLYPGVESLFQRLRDFIAQEKKLREANISIEFYVISGGFEEILKGTRIAGDIGEHRIFGCSFHETSKGIAAPKSVVTFTEKTKFLYAINKGVIGEIKRNPFSVNDVIKAGTRRIPFTNMIYIGDGPTDIPCFSTVQQNGGKTIGVLKYETKPRKPQLIVDKRRAWAIARGERTTLGPYPPNYEKDSALYINLEMQVERIGLDIYDAYLRRDP